MRIAVSTLLTLLVCVSAQAQTLGKEAYWAARDAALSHITFDYELTTTENRLFPTPSPAQTLQVGPKLVTIPEVHGPWYFEKKSHVRLRRDGPRLAVTGSYFSPDAGTGQPIESPIRSFADSNWVGALDESPINGDPKNGVIHVYGSKELGYRGIVPGTGLLIDGFFNVFLIGADPLHTFGMNWSTIPRPNGSLQMVAQNYFGGDTVVNRVPDPLAADFSIDIDQAGHLLGGSKFVEKNVMLNGSPAHPIPRLLITVRKWKIVAGYSVPSDLVWRINLDNTGRYPKGYTEHEWRLESATVDSERAEPTFPTGALVVDFRRDVKELEFAERFAQDAEPQYYKWDGSLVSQETLDKMSKEHSRPVALNPWSILAYMIPAILIFPGFWLMFSGSGPSGRKIRSK